jgi:hypothetical protein
LLSYLGGIYGQVFKECAVKCGPFVQIDIGDCPADVAPRNSPRRKTRFIHNCDSGPVNGVEHNVGESDAIQGELFRCDGIIWNLRGSDSIVGNLECGYSTFRKIVRGD